MQDIRSKEQGQGQVWYKYVKYGVWGRDRGKYVKLDRVECVMVVYSLDSIITINSELISKVKVLGQYSWYV